MICTIIGGGCGVNKVDNFIGYKIGLNYTYQYVDVDCTVMYDNPDRLADLNPPNLHTLKHWKGDYLYNNIGSKINYTPGEVISLNSSAIMAVNVAIHLGYTEIYLVGCENRVDEFHHFYDTEPISEDKRKVQENIFNKFFKPMWDKVNPEKGERLIFVDSDIDRFENITIEEYNKLTPYINDTMYNIHRSD